MIQADLPLFQLRKLKHVLCCAVLCCSAPAIHLEGPQHGAQELG